MGQCPKCRGFAQTTGQSQLYRNTAACKHAASTCMGRSKSQSLMSLRFTFMSTASPGAAHTACEIVCIGPAHTTSSGRTTAFTCAWRRRARLRAARAACSAGRRPRAGTPRAASRSPQTQHPPARSPAAGRLRPSSQVAVPRKKECFFMQSSIPGHRLCHNHVIFDVQQDLI